ncbi:AAC(3) family N-acetyltransferase [Kitasatospora sp. NPDC094015]|uniref:aminoglycoside N(3)-acetyltransferase n=1 Tax=Kitasatospora sp. NPDC094015 TaxID=3155205 RepID=UPI00331E2A4A
MYSVETLAADLRRLGVQPGETLLVQSSTRAIGAVAGGSAAVVAAVREVLGPHGTLVVYTATPENSDTSPLDAARTAGLDPAGLRAFRASMPAFDRARTPASPSMGRIAEEVRTTAGAVRSAHPQTSFTALGPKAERLMAGHRLTCHLGEQSPTHRLYQDGARALLIGVPLWCCTPFHLAEYWQPEQVTQRYGCVVRDERQRRQWVHFDALRLEVRHFEALGQVLGAELPSVREGVFGAAPSFLLPVAEAVDHVNKWLRNRWS